MQPFQLLIVDDEERFVTNLAKILKAHNFGIFTAFSGEQAVDRLASHGDIAVVIMDVRMPGMDGLAALQQIKQLYPGIEVIMLTGQATLEDGLQALRLGAFDYLQKPCDIEELVAKIESACSVKRIKRSPVLWPRKKAGDIVLSGILPLLPEDTLDRALEIFDRYRNGKGARILFVTNHLKHINGSIRRGDLPAAFERENPGKGVTWKWLRHHLEYLPRCPVSTIMENEVATVSPETNLAEAARLMLLNHYDSIPVISEEAMIGIIRLRDVLLHLEAADENVSGD